MLQAVVQNQADGWNLTLEYLDRFLESRRLSDTAPPGTTSVHGGFLELARILGKRTAELHCALARPTSDPAFAPEPIAPADVRGWADRIGEEVEGLGADWMVIDTVKGFLLRGVQKRFTFSPCPAGQPQSRFLRN